MDDHGYYPSSYDGEKWADGHFYGVWRPPVIRHKGGLSVDVYPVNCILSYCRFCNQSKGGCYSSSHMIPVGVTR